MNQHIVFESCCKHRLYAIKRVHWIQSSSAYETKNKHQTTLCSPPFSHHHRSLSAPPLNGREVDRQIPAMSTYYWKIAINMSIVKRFYVHPKTMSDSQATQLEITIAKKQSRDLQWFIFIAIDRFRVFLLFSAIVWGWIIGTLELWRGGRRGSLCSTQND